MHDSLQISVKKNQVSKSITPAEKFGRNYFSYKNVFL